MRVSHTLVSGRAGIRPGPRLCSSSLSRWGLGGQGRHTSLVSLLPPQSLSTCALCQPLLHSASTTQSSSELLGTLLSPLCFSRLNSLNPQPRPPPLFSPPPQPLRLFAAVATPAPKPAQNTRTRPPHTPDSSPSPPPPPRGATYPRGGSGGGERRSGVGEEVSVRGGSQPRGAGAGASGSGGAASPPGGGSGGGGAVPLPQAHIGSIVRRRLPLSGSPLPVPPLPPPLGPPPAAPRHERYRRPRLGRERRSAPSPGPGVPPGGGLGTAPPRLGAGPAAGKGPPPSKGMSLVPPPGTRAMVPTRPLPPPLPRPSRRGTAPSAPPTK
uniref:proline-rich protein 2-like n=1 Tax=Panthera onca TaxID=9690 RepID=UPI002953E42C|nr:proline-rich protein 2-like [Panthera onca]